MFQIIYTLQNISLDAGIKRNLYVEACAMCAKQKLGMAKIELKQKFLIVFFGFFFLRALSNEQYGISLDQHKNFINQLFIPLIQRGVSPNLIESSKIHMDYCWKHYLIDMEQALSGFGSGRERAKVYKALRRLTDEIHSLKDGMK